MDERENLVTEEVTENVEETTEETTEEVEQIADETPEKVYTEDEFQQKVKDTVGKRLARKEAKIRKEYEKRYGGLENVLKAGTGLEDVEEITGNFRQFYEGKGIQIPNEAKYSDRDIAVLAKAEAEDIISSGYEEVVEEVDRLASIGIDKMSAREKALFRNLAEYRKSAEQARELSKLGVPEEVYKSKEFTDFAAKFGSNTSQTEIYQIYAKMQPKKEIKSPGSMKSSAVEDNSVKDFYSYEEASKFTKADFDKNPALYKAVERSMQKW